MTIAEKAMSARSTKKATLLLVANRLDEPAKNTIDVWISVYSEFMPSRQGVTMVLLMMDWNTMDAPPMEKAVMSMTASLGARIFMAYQNNFGLSNRTSTSIYAAAAARVSKIMRINLRRLFFCAREIIP